MRGAEPVEHRGRIQPAVVAELAGDRLEGFREGPEEELVAPGDGAGVLAEVALKGGGGWKFEEEKRRKKKTSVSFFGGGEKMGKNSNGKKQKMKNEKMKKS